MASAAGSSWCASCSAAATSLLLDEPTNHLDADARNWLLQVPAPVPRRAARGQPRPRPARRGDHPGPAPRSREPRTAPATLVEYKGTYSQYLDGPRSRRRSPRPPSCADARPEIQPAQDARRLDARPDRQAGTRGQEPRPARRRRSRRKGRARPTKRRTLNLASPRRRRADARCSTATELWKSFGALDVFSDVSFDVGRGERLLVMGLNGAGKTTLLKVAGRAARPRPRRRSSSGPTSRSATTPRSTKASWPGARCSSTCATRPTTRRRRAARLARHVRPERRRRRSRTRPRSRVARRRSSRWRSSSAGSHNLLLLDEPTNNLDPAVAHRDRRGPGARGRAP